MKYVSKRELRFRLRSADSHKGENGRVVIVGGSEDYVGAAYLAGMAALRAGADIITIAAPEKVAWTINAMSPDLITSKLPGRSLKEAHLRLIDGLLKKADVMLIGNGLGSRKETIRAVQLLVQRDLPKVIDADAIAAVKMQGLQDSLLTPHRQEASALCRKSSIPTDNVRAIQKSLGSNVLLMKGQTDTIISRDRVAYNKTGNSAMTVGGTGDVLAGLCAGLAAQGHTLYEAACMASYVNGLAGDIAYKKRGRGLLASELLEHIGRIVG
jgi:hydroxyethylthiazole kinase-like uncharacterized protein yjeF